MQVAGQNEVRAPHRRGGLLRQRNFRLLWIGESVSGIGNAMAVVGIPLLAVTVLRASTFAVAALTAAAYLPWLVIGLPAGAWVDRLPARPLISAETSLPLTGAPGEEEAAPALGPDVAGDRVAVPASQNANAIATSTVRNIAHRATSSCGEVAVAEMLGTGNWGAGPGFGPTA